MNDQTNVVQLPSKTAIGLVATLMIFAAFAAFGAATSFGFLNFDDSYLVVNNLVVRGPTLEHIHAAFTTYDPELYIPVTLLSYQLNWLVAGLQPGIYHATNILLHGLNAFLFSAILWLLLGRASVAIFFGLIFAIHPLNTEAAAWVSGRKDVLSTFFLLCSTVLFLRYTDTRNKKMWVASILLYILASLSKSSVVVLPLLLPLLQFLKKGERETLRTYTKELWPFFFIAIGTGVIALFGKTRVVGGLSIIETTLLALKSSAFYLQKIFLPYHLSAIYPQTTSITISSPDILSAGAVIAILFGVSIYLYKKTSWPMICLALFFISIAPSFLNAHKGTQTFFAVDRYAYIGMMWILLLFAALSFEVTERLTKKQTQFVAAVILLPLLYLSYHQTKVWANDITVLEHSLALYPASVSARTGLPAAYRDSGQFGKELSVVQEGLKYSDDVALLLAIGSIDARQGRVEEAENLYRKAMVQAPENPEPHFYLAALLEQKNQPDEAAIEYAKAIAIDPSYTGAYNNLGSIAMDKGDYAEAEKQFKNALSWNQNIFESQYNLFQVLEFQKKREEGFPHLEKAYQLRHDFPEVGLSYGYRLHELGRDKEAITVLQQVLSLDPTNRTALRLLEVIDPSSKPVNSDTTNEEQRRAIRQQERLQAL